MTDRSHANAATRYLRGELVETCVLHEAIRRFSARSFSISRARIKRNNRRWRRRQIRSAA